MQEALALVRRELGPSAAVLHTREIGGSPLLSWIPGLRRIEITASTDVNVPSRLPRRPQQQEARPAAAPGAEMVPGIEWEAKSMFRDEVKDRLDDLHSLVEDLCRRTRPSGERDWPDSLVRLHTELLDAEVPEELARELIEHARREAPAALLADSERAADWVIAALARSVSVRGPIAPPAGRRHVVALVGPTGVGKTTTIAKLAANFRLREQRRVGLITVDTYRIAAVEQLRTYADIIDLPMEVVATPHEMRAALERLAHLDLVLLDTAGRSPQDDLKLRELAAMLQEAEADEVHLVLSSVASASTLTRAAERFASVGTTALLLTKLDEATALGHLLPVVRASGLPLSYLTSGQNVPDDIAAADPRELATMMVRPSVGWLS
jgi:flagellar biosynthesis protein FlhF